MPHETRITQGDGEFSGDHSSTLDDRVCARVERGMSVE
jgi:hypothetical protein